MGRPLTRLNMTKPIRLVSPHTLNALHFGVRFLFLYAERRRRKIRLSNGLIDYKTYNDTTFIYKSILGALWGQTKGIVLGYMRDTPSPVNPLSPATEGYTPKGSPQLLAKNFSQKIDFS